MALAPKFAGQKFVAGVNATAVPTLHTLELYLDYVCPVCVVFFFLLYYFFGEILFWGRSRVEPLVSVRFVEVDDRMIEWVIGMLS